MSSTYVRLIGTYFLFNGTIATCATLSRNLSTRAPLLISTRVGGWVIISSISRGCDNDGVVDTVIHQEAATTAAASLYSRTETINTGTNAVA